MKPATSKAGRKANRDMRPEYNFRGGVRGKHYHAMQAGYRITIHKSDGTTVVKNVKPQAGTIKLAPDVRAYFSDADSVNKALRSLITLVPTKRKTKLKKAQ